jgi:hypothetical protein
MGYKNYWLYTLSIFAILSLMVFSSIVFPAQKKYNILDKEPNYTTVAPSSIMLSQKCGPIFTVQDMKNMVLEIPDTFYFFNTIKTEPPSPPGLIPAFGYAAKEGLKPKEITYYPPDSDIYLNESTILRTMWDNDIIVIWYDKNNLTENDEETFRLLSANTLGELLIIPWMEYENSTTMPLNRNIAYASIGTTLTCEGFNINVLNEFRQYTLDNPKHTVGDNLKQGDIDYSLILPEIEQE